MSEAAVQHQGSVKRYTIVGGAWCRGDAFKDLTVTVTHEASGAVGHVSLSHRSLTPAAAAEVARLGNTGATPPTGS